MMCDLTFDILSMEILNISMEITNGNHTTLQQETMQVSNRKSYKFLTGYNTGDHRSTAPDYLYSFDHHIKAK